MIEAKTSRRVAIAAIALTAVVYAYYGFLPLAEPDEARYAEMAREMLDTGDWVTPQLNYQPFLDKPPLLYWLSAGAFHLFGTNELAARLPVMLAALLGLWATFLLARAMYGPTTAALAVAILATSPLYFGMGQILTMDMLLAACTTVALLAAWQGFRERDRKWYRLAYVATGFGLLAKGPIAAILVALPVVVLLLHQRDRRQIRLALDLPGMLLMVAIAMPWFLAAEAANPGFLAGFLFHHHVDRFFDPWHHREPAWFYLYVLPVALLPWTLLWLLDVRHAGLRLRRWSAPTVYLVAWTASTVVLFSLSRSKLVPYVLPALPPLAILLARLYERLLATESARFLDRAPLAFAVVGAVLALVGGVFWTRSHPRLLRLAPLLATSGVLLMGEAWVLHRLRSAGARLLAFATAVASVVGLLLMVEQGRDLARSYSGIGRAAAAIAAPGDQLVMTGGYMPALGFYTGRRAVVLADDDVVHLGELWAADRTVLLVTRRDRLASIGDETGAPPAIVFEERDKVLVSNAPARARAAARRQPS